MVSLQKFRLVGNNLSIHLANTNIKFTKKNQLIGMKFCDIRFVFLQIQLSRIFEIYSCIK